MNMRDCCYNFYFLPLATKEQVRGVNVSGQDMIILIQRNVSFNNHSFLKLSLFSKNNVKCLK